jgi:putative transposase
MKAATDTLDNVIVKRPLCKQNLCLDKGYDSSEIEREVIKRKYITHIRHRGEEKGLIKTRHSARRWVVVERTNSWHNRFRKLLVRYEKKSENYLALLFSLLYYCLQEDNFGIGS